MHEANRPTTLYRLFDPDGDLLYVGIAGNPGRRFEQHAATKAWWGSVDTIRLQHFPDRHQARTAELEAIALELPSQNIQDIPHAARQARLWPGTLARFSSWCSDCRDSGALWWKSDDARSTFPTGAWVEGESLTCSYHCTTCGHRWNVWFRWRDLPVRAA